LGQTAIFTVATSPRRFAHVTAACHSVEITGIAVVLSHDARRTLLACPGRSALTLTPGRVKVTASAIIGTTSAFRAGTHGISRPAVEALAKATVQVQLATFATRMGSDSAVVALHTSPRVRATNTFASGGIESSTVQAVLGFEAAGLAGDAVPGARAVTSAILGTSNSK